VGPEVCHLRLVLLFVGHKLLLQSEEVALLQEGLKRLPVLSTRLRRDLTMLLQACIQSLMVGLQFVVLGLHLAKERIVPCPGLCLFQMQGFKGLLQNLFQDSARGLLSPRTVALTSLLRGFLRTAADPLHLWTEIQA